MAAHALPGTILRIHRQAREFRLAVGFGAALVCFAAAPVGAQPAATGRVTGTVVEKGKTPIEFANVIILGTKLGTMTDANGNFVLTSVQTGTVQVQVQPLGYDKQVQTVQVNAGATSQVSFNFGESKVVKQIEEIEVTAAKRIDTKSSSSVQNLSAEKLREIPVDNLKDAVGTKAGVVAQGGELHVRGGRGGEVKFQVSGVENSDPLLGRSAGIATLAIAGTDIISGGFDAEYGNALSGVVNVSTREGTDRFGGEVRWDTDRYGDPTKTFNNFDRVTFGFGGPTPFRNLTYFATYEGTFSDTYLRSTLTKPSTTVLDFLQFGNRQQNIINTNFKLAYRMNPRNKVTLETIQNRSINTPYSHMWSRDGFVKVNYDTASHRKVYGSWSATKVDSTYQPANMPDHFPTQDDKYHQITAVWTNQISDKSVITARASSYSYDTGNSVGHKQPWEYDTESPNYWSGNTVVGSENNPYYATHGDYPVYSQRYAATQTFKADFSTRRWRQHTFKTGIETRYDHVRDLNLTLPNAETGGEPGGSRSDFVNYAPQGSAYVQDRWEFEGLVLNLGVRYDMFTPGISVLDQELQSGKRYKQQLSPRLGIAYPISDKDVLSFFYGRTYQNPAYNQVFQARGQSTSILTLGNPDLEPETNIAYQAAVQHLFSRDVSGQFTVFFKDIYGLVTTRQKSLPSGDVVNYYFNADYASSRGFEASIIKSFSHKFSTEINYTYSLASGVASDPNSALQFLNGNQLYLPISEQALDWDQRNTLSLQAVVREPGRWGFRVLWQYGSGFPFTPAFLNDRRPDPALQNSRRLPANSRLTIDGDKYYKIWGQNMTLFFDARNVLNVSNIASLSYTAFPNQNVNRNGDDYTIYYTQTGRAGGAFLQDINGDGIDDWVPVNDPRVYEEGRNVRLGLSVTF
ncbi:MAG: TonB-dependent receptor [Candidatus Eisenbacteria bacterium]|uniref:TonB-dependent receptor n=1 Tax=Eiseniibacteriota bacterium TaxID=2212470 RepID=A0A538SZB0_UNCEI|nr:MAG: TonB-dependent receptor [Candidatus Eisenbacteria bacterium]